MVAIAGLLLMLFLGIAVLIVVAVIVIYNRLVRLRTTVKSSWSDIDVNLKKRYDLVPNLVETVKGYAGHERAVFENVALARSAAMKATSPGDKAKSENMFTETLKSLFAVVEAYPQLQANTNFLQLQQQLKELEDNIEYSRRYFNAVVRDYNIMTETFPSNIIAGQFKFEKSEFFELEEAAIERKPTKVSFS
ncbi:MAG: LemA family protein [Nitrospirae bacterium]|nr:LemA family protein [Nitrospirota bacterium]